MCLRDPRPMSGRTSRAPPTSSAPPPRRRRTRRVHLVRVGDRRDAGTIGREDSPHRGWYLSQYERSKHLGRTPRVRARRRARRPGRRREPLLGAGAGPQPRVGQADARRRERHASRSSSNHVSLVDIGDCPRATCSPSRAGCRASATSSRADDHDPRAVELLEPHLGTARARPFGAARVARAGGGARARPGGCSVATCRSVPRPSERCCTAIGTTDRKAERELGLRYTPLEETLRERRVVRRAGLPPPKLAPSPGRGPDAGACEEQA